VKVGGRGGMERVGCLDWREVETKSRVTINNNSWRMKQSILTISNLFVVTN
jgi:hypothetical protein